MNVIRWSSPFFHDGFLFRCFLDLRAGAGVTGVTAGAVGVMAGVTVGTTAGEGVTVAGDDVIAGAGRAALDGADKLAKSASDSRLIVAR